MEPYKHTVQYYETDKMGITHHSNYIRWMEEARIDFLKQAGWDYAKLESLGLISPVVEVNCRYKKPTVFPEEVTVFVAVKEFTGVKLRIGYEMKNAAGAAVAEAESLHCFVNPEGRPVRLDRQLPEFAQTLRTLAEKE